jgi:zinc protease
MKKIICFLFCVTVAQLHAQEIPKLETYSLKNGLKVYLMPYGKIPAVNIKFWVNTGEKNEAPGQQGYCEITSELLLWGNSKYTQEQQNNLMYKLGGNWSADYDHDYTTITADVLNKDLDISLDLLSSAVLRPTFAKEKLDLMLSHLMDYNNPSKMDVADLADVFGDLFTYSISNPLGRNYYKTQLNAITPEKIREFHEFNYTPKNTSIIVCGNFDAAQVKNLIDKYFGNWQSKFGEVNGVALDAPQIKKKEMAFINRSGSTQCAFQWNKIAPGLKDKDLLAFKVANAIYNRVLFSEIREKGGKTYGIRSRHHPSRFSNLYSVECSVRSDEMYNTIQLFDKTLQNFSLANISQEDFDKAITGLKVSVMGAETPGEISGIFNPILYDFEKQKNYLNELSLIKIEEVQKAIKKYFSPDSYKLVISGDESVIAAQIKKLPGLVMYKPIDIEKDN